MLLIKINLYALILVSCGFVVAQFFLYAFLTRSLGISNLQKDLGALDDVCRQIGIILYLIDPKALTSLENGYRLALRKLNISDFRLIRLAIDTSLLRNPQNVGVKLVPSLVSKGFTVESFYDSSSEPRFPEWPLAVVLKRSSVPFLIQFFHDYEDSSWWYGNLMACSSFSSSIAALNLDPAIFPNHESIIDKFRLHPLALNGSSPSNIWIPKYQAEFLSEVENAKFLECNYTRAKEFESYLRQTDRTTSARFTHKVTKLLSTVKTVLDGLEVAFWISSGTCLGYFRHCSVIPHSKDVDIGIFTSDFSENIISSLEKHDLKMKLWFGEPNDSMEISFESPSNLKLDIFFFYQEGDIMWNGGTQLRTGKKFKYIFPKFDLCWTIFLGIKLRIPCNTETYIRANYGPQWYLPIANWDWKTSPFNVKENGFWPIDRRKHVMRVFD